MMSPLSIAQYLPPDSRPFDVVIFDEASQIPVWDAIGAIARGNQVVIVGDPEQLPPTSVGERGVDDNDDGIDVEDQESILDECLAANIPKQQLEWHYRSRHESLIAFSNNEYYRGRLVTFPSPVTDDRAVRYVHVPNGIYERGAGRVNREEARAVVAEIIRRLKQPEFAGLKSSLGVVTFNGEQQRLVENLLDQERRSHPELEAFFDPARWHEPVFVKNLENVQGDERDVILFSVAVAPDHGRPVATISSLNKEGGHRRLNVAITRARQEMVVFATLRPEQIDLSRTNARGVRDFKHFLEFAERGARAMAEAFAATGADTESPFEDAVKAALESRGWSVHTQIGVSKFRIDLGIVDPDAPGRYLAGVECDGATYHGSATARDRDRLREHVLTGLGWRIRRVWSTDWWSDANRALDRLHQQLEADLESSRAARRKAEQEAQEAAERAATQPAAEQQAQPLPADDGADEPTGDPIAATLAEIEAAIAAAATVSGFNEPDVAPPLQPPAAPAEARSYADAAPPARQAGLPGHVFPEYRAADLVAAGFQLEPDRFHDPLYRARLRQMVAHVIAAEGPIYDDVLVRRIARLHGFARAGGRIRETVLGCVNNRLRRDIEDDRIVFWPEGANIGLPIPFRRSADGARDHGEVPLTELASLARPMLLEGAGTEETIRRMAAYFGLNRVSETSRQRFAAAIDLAHADDQA
jgi:very-short-patch-repair endonuclease